MSVIELEVRVIDLVHLTVNYTLSSVLTIFDFASVAVMSIVYTPVRAGSVSLTWRVWLPLTFISFTAFGRGELSRSVALYSSWLGQAAGCIEYEGRVISYYGSLI